MSDETQPDRVAGVEIPKALTIMLIGAMALGAFKWWSDTNEERAATAERETTIISTLKNNTAQLETIRDTMATEDDVAVAREQAVGEAKREARMYTDSQLEPISRQQATIDANLQGLKDRTISVEQEVTKGFDRMDARLREIDRSVSKQVNQ